jgi:hypothetical protein
MRNAPGHRVRPRPAPGRRPRRPLGRRALPARRQGSLGRVRLRYPRPGHAQRAAPTATAGAWGSVRGVTSGMRRCGAPGRC